MIQIFDPRFVGPERCTDCQSGFFRSGLWHGKFFRKIEFFYITWTILNRSAILQQFRIPNSGPDRIETIWNGPEFHQDFYKCSENGDHGANKISDQKHIPRIVPYQSVPTVRPSMVGDFMIAEFCFCKLSEVC